MRSLAFIIHPEANYKDHGRKAQQRKGDKEGTQRQVTRCWIAQNFVTVLHEECIANCRY